ncbi:hypothetical protein M0R72_16980 [Candidatus Pacearchaeota archaeon]|jgi:hypothetical protein|nr:hypothetical protein [Candidatus Pacearchaeota archaeon]
MECDTEYDPVSDMKRALERLHQPPNYTAMAEMEKQVNMLTDILTSEGKSPVEIAALYIKYGIWP